MNKEIQLLIARGFCVIPVEEKSKKPAVIWKDYQTSKPSDEVTEGWLASWGKKNVGVVLRSSLRWPC